ncbi:MAG: hypothetical protein ACR2NB_00815 [Solirubrobacteraceae bacterium]
MLRLRELPARLGEPLDGRVAPLVVDEAVDPEVDWLDALLPAPDEPVAGAAGLTGAAAGAPAAAGGDVGGAAGLPPGPLEGGAVGGDGGGAGDEGVPKPGEVHAHARLAPATATLNNDSTATQTMRIRRCIRLLPPLG